MEAFSVHRALPGRDLGGENGGHATDPRGALVAVGRL
jgi:hypothetical protein